MGEPRSTKTLSPHSVAAVASSLVLVVGLGLGVYFVELRGPGLRAVLAGNQAQEILILFGAIAAIAITGHFAIANAVRQSRASQAYRRLIHRALELDHTDPGALRQFDVVPELRDLVSSLIAEKSMTRELSDQIETLRGETSGLLQGMERSVQTLGALRQEGLSDLGQKVAGLWNDLLDRASKAEEEAQKKVEERVEAKVGSGFSDEPAEFAVEQTQAAFNPVDSSPTTVNPQVEQRIEKLENEVERLWTTVESLPGQTPEQPQETLVAKSDSPFADATPVFSPPTPVVSDVEPSPSSVTHVGTPSDVPATGSSFAPFEETPAELTEDPLTMGKSSLEMPPPLSEPAPQPPAEPAVQATPEPPRFTEWSGEESIRDDGGIGAESIWGAAEEATAESSSPVADPDGAAETVSDPSAGFTEEKFALPFSAVTDAAQAPTPPQLDAEPSFDDLNFPHFVGRPVKETEDHVKVTYEKGTAKPEELPASALLFEPEDGEVDETESVVDLRSLGAVEFKE